MLTIFLPFHLHFLTGVKGCKYRNKITHPRPVPAWLPSTRITASLTTSPLGAISYNHFLSVPFSWILLTLKVEALSANHYPQFHLGSLGLGHTTEQLHNQLSYILITVCIYILIYIHYIYTYIIYMYICLHYILVIPQLSS